MKSFLRQNFNTSAVFYEKYALAQKDIAKKLATFYRKDFLHRVKMLEIGCGTGFMTKEVLDIAPQSNILAIDIASNMLAQFKRRYPNIPCQCMDGEEIHLDMEVDCIYSNLAMQWFSHLPETLVSYKKMLKENGVLIFSILLRENFPEWQEACNYAGIDHGQDMFFSQSEIGRILERDFSVKSIVETLEMKFLKSTDFLLHIKKIGAKCRKNTTSISGLRKACAYLGKHKDNRVSYQVAYIKACKK